MLGVRGLPGRLAALTGVLVLTASGCGWTQAGQGPGRGGWNPFELHITSATVGSLGLAWMHTVAAPAPLQAGQAHEAIIPSGTAYVPGAGTLTAFDLASGSSPWTSAGIGSDPVVVGGRMREPVGGLACDIFDIDLATGGFDLSFERQFGPPLASPCLAGPALGAGGEVFVPWAAVQRSNGTACLPLEDWLVTTGVDAIALAGSRWHHFTSSVLQCSASRPPPAPLPFGPLSAVGALIVGARTTPGVTTVEALRAADGTKVWTTDIGAPVNQPVVGTNDGDIALTTGDGRLVVLDGATGTLEWSAAITATLPPAATSSTIFVATPAGVLSAFPASGCGSVTCTPTWTATTESPASARPSIGRDVVYVGSSDGTVTAFPANGCGASACTSLWSGATGSEVTGAPAIASGHLVVGSANGTVTAFRVT